MRMLHDKLNDRLLELLSLGAVLALAFLFGFRQIFDGDLFYHLANGREILRQGAIPATNSLVWAESELPFYPNPAWLYGAGIALLERAAGLSGLVWLKTVVVVALFGVLYRLCRRQGAGLVQTPALLLLFGMAAAFRLTDRPHLFSLLFFAICLLLLADLPGKAGRRLWLLPPLFALWANLHAGFVFGLVLIGAFCCGEIAAGGWRRNRPSLERLAWVLGSCALATLMTPNPLTNYRFLAELLVPRIFPITEYFSPSVGANPWFFAVTALLVLWAIWRRARPHEWRWLLPTLVFLALACYSVRFIPFFLMTALPWTVHSLSAWPGLQRGSVFNLSPAWQTVWWGLLLLAMPAALLLWPPVSSTLGLGVSPDVAPMGSVRFLDQSRWQGRLYNSQSYGGLGACYLAPHYRMYQTSYFQVEKDRIEAAYLASKDPAAWKSFLDRNAVDLVWLDTTREPHSQDYYPLEDWALVYYDDFSVVFVRRQSPNAAALAPYEYRVANPPLLATASAVEVGDSFAIATGISEARRALNYAPESLQARSLLAFFLARQPGAEVQALSELEVLEKRTPDLADVHFEKGRMLARLGRHGEAEQAFERYVALAPDDPEGAFELARSLLAAGQAGRAREVLLQMIEQFPEQGQGYLLLGTIQLNADQLPEAWSSLERARALLTTNAEVPNLLGIVKAQQGEMAAAIDLFQQALALDPAYESARLNLQRALRESGSVR